MTAKTPNNAKYGAKTVSLLTGSMKPPTGSGRRVGRERSGNRVLLSSSSLEDSERKREMRGKQEREENGKRA
jgi:hypothetical protein